MRRRLLLLTLATLTIGITTGLSACQRLFDPFHVPPPSDCEVPSQNQFVVDVMREYYLWTDDLPDDIDIAAYDTPEALVSDLRQGVDRWTRVRDKGTSNALFMEGKYIGFGFKTKRDDEDNVRVAFVNDGSPAGNAGMLRSDKIVSVNGITAAELDDTSGWNDVYGANEPGVDIEVEVERWPGGEIETLAMTKDWIDIVSIPVAEVFERSDGTKVGYYIMDKFVETTKDELENAYALFKANGVGPVIIDMRYNGGGLISVAERQVNLTLGADHKGDVAYSFVYNSNYSDQNYSTKISERDNSLGADEIVVLTSRSTLSASELVINALFPYAEVTLIGSDTGGKPVGSKSFEFCDKLLFPITFRLANGLGDTDYFDGLPADCYAEDDVFHQIGDPEEGMLAAALAFLDDGTCMDPPASPDDAPLDLAPARWPDSLGESVLPFAEERDEIDYW